MQIKLLARISAFSMLALGLSACASLSNASVSNIGNSNNDAATASDGNTTPIPAIEFTPPPVSPIDQFLAYVEGTNLSLEAQVRQREVEYAEDQELIAACMAEQGFTYYPDQFMEFTISAA